MAGGGRNTKWPPPLGLYTYLGPLEQGCLLSDIPFLHLTGYVEGSLWVGKDG